MSPQSHKFVGVPTSHAIVNIQLIKQQLLLFDEIMFIDPGLLEESLTPELELLIDKGLVSASDIDPGLHNNSESYQMAYQGFVDATKQFADEYKKASAELLVSGDTYLNLWDLPSTNLIDEYAVRLKILELRNSEGVDAVPVFFRRPFSNPLKNPRREEVMRIILGFMPTPDRSTSLERIIDFRSDPDSRRKFVALKNFINDIGRSNLQRNEILDRIEWLINEYKAHSDMHKLRYGRSSLEILVTTTANTIENIVRLKVGKAIQGLFDVQRQRADLLKAELETPGREIAYLIKVQDQFSE